MATNRKYSFVTKICEDCDEDFEIVITAAHRSTRCPKCRIIKNRQYQNKLQREKYVPKPRPLFITPMPYIMKVDPDHSWGLKPENTRLGLQDIQCMMKQGHLTPGTVFYNEQKRRSYEVVLVDNLQKLKQLEC